MHIQRLRSSSAALSNITKPPRLKSSWWVRFTTSSGSSIPANWTPGDVFSLSKCGTWDSRKQSIGNFYKIKYFIKLLLCPDRSTHFQCKNHTYVTELNILRSAVWIFWFEAGQGPCSNNLDSYFISAAWFIWLEITAANCHDSWLFSFEQGGIFQLPVGGGKGARFWFLS